MTLAEDVRNNLEFKIIEDGLVSYQINNNAHGDNWKKILVFYNAKDESYKYQTEGIWQLAVLGNDFYSANKINNVIEVPKISMVIVFQTE